MTKSILAFQFIGVEAPKVSKFLSKTDALRDNKAWFMPLDEEELAINNINAPTSGMVALYNILQPNNPVKKFSDRASAAKRLFAVCNEIVTLKEPEMNTETQTQTEDEKRLAGLPENISEQMAKAAADQKAAREAAAADKARIAEEKRVAAEAKKAERATAKAEKDAIKAQAKADREAAAATKKAEREANKGAAGTGRASPNKGKLIKLGKNASLEDGTVRNPRREGTYGHKSMQIIIDAGDAGITYEAFIAAGGRSNDLNWDVEHNNAVLTDAPATTA